MRRLDIVRRAGKNLRQAKMRTILTSLAIGVGAFTLTLSLAAGAGARDYANKLIGSNINPRAMFIVKDDAVFGGGGGAPSTNSELREYDPSGGTVNGRVFKQLSQKDIDTITARKDLEEVVPIYQITPRYFKLKNGTKKYTADLAVYDATIIGESSEGSLPSLGEQIGPRDVVLPEEFAKTLAKDTDKSTLIGQKIILTVARPNQSITEADAAKILAEKGPAGLADAVSGSTKDVELTIVALAKKSATTFQANSSLQVSPTQARDLAEYTTKGTDNYQKHFGVTALVKSGDDPEKVKSSLKDAGYPSQTAKDLQNLIFTIVNTLQGIVVAFGIIALIASVFGIINTQYISVLERTSQIGLMKALGMRGRDIAKLFRYEAAWIGFLGGVIGAAVAWGVGTPLNPWISEQLSLGADNYLLKFVWWHITLLIIGLMLVAIVAGWWPARKAAKLDPIEALRTE